MIANGLLDEIECDRVVMELSHRAGEVEVDPTAGEEVVRKEVCHVSFVTSRALS